MNKRPRILIAPNAFKGSLSVTEACRAFAEGARRAAPAARLDLMPIADGGDGVMDCLLAAKGGRKFYATVTGPLGRAVRAPWALLSDGTACIEMARASGLALVPPAKRHPLRASTRGTGELIAAALDRGAKTIVVGLGGTASSDGGAGMAQALVARLLDARGQELPPGAGALTALDRIDAKALRRRMKGARVIGVTDVTNPLLGPRGSAATYGPQKGATPAQVTVIERALGRLAAALERDLGADVAKTPGAGAAGGCGAGLIAFLGAELVPGADYVLDACGADSRIKEADAVLTGEGRLDATSFFGKAPVELARRARRAKVPVAVVCGDVDAAARPRLARLGVRSAVSLADAGAKPAQSMREAARWAAKAAALALKGLALAAVAAGVVGASEFSTADNAYFHRNAPGQLEAALSTAQAKAASDKTGEWEWRLARALIRRGERKSGKKDKLADFKAAEDAAQRAVDKSSASADAHFWLGVAHGRRGETQGILKSLSLVGPIKREMETTLRLDPTYGGAYHVLAELYWQLPGFAGGDKKKALQYYEKALEVSPRYSANYVPLAEAYLKLGRKDDARRVLEKLRQLKDPADPADFPNDLKDAQDLEAKLK